MLGKDHQEIFLNRAKPTGSVSQENRCDGCVEPIIFAMRDKEHTFSIGLVTILNCVKTAEELGELPKLPDDWWLTVEMRYGWDAVKP